MMTRRIATTFSAAIFAATFVALSANAATIAGWDQNGNANVLAPTGFGFEPADFPQANEHGPATASHGIADFLPAVDGNGIYTQIQSFAGTTNNDLEGAGAGGSFSFLGGPESATGSGVFTGNGAKSVFAVPTTGYTDISVSWSQRGTATGFSSRVFEYSTNGGTSWVDIGAYNHTDATPASSGALGATFKTVDLDLSAITGLDNNAGAMFRITYSGATSATGNNRWDNFYVEGTLVPEPTSFVLLCLSGFALIAYRRSK